MMMVKQEAESLIKKEVRQVLLGTNEFTQIEVATNLSMDFSKKEVVEHNYTPADGQEQGVLSHEDISPMQQMHPAVLRIFKIHSEITPVTQKSSESW